VSVESRLSSIRRQRGISAAKLAERVDVNRQTIYAIEAGNYVPNTAVALRLARELEVAVEELFRLEEPPESRAQSVGAVMLSARPAATGLAVRVAKVKTRWVCAPADLASSYFPPADARIVRASKDRKRAEIELISPEDCVERRLVIAGCDPAIGLLAGMAERLFGVEVVAIPAASRRALGWLKEGKVHIAGSHLEDAASGEFNLPHLRRLMPDEDLTVMTFARWEEGFVVARGNPLGIRRAADLARPRIRIINREPGSGSRILLDNLLRRDGIPAEKVSGYGDLADGHLAAARAVAASAADCCLATASAARALSLDFVPLHAERFDFAVRREFLHLPAVRCVQDLLQRAALRRQLESLAGYDTSETGRLLRG
jgi:molybdate-binding protein/DNA-binding XRE family transcriptional regulator